LEPTESLLAARPLASAVLPCPLPHRLRDLRRPLGNSKALAEKSYGGGFGDMQPDDAYRYPRARYGNAPCGDTDSMLTAAEKMSRAIKDHDEYGRWPRQRGTVQIRQPDSRFCLASQGVRRASGASDGAAKREQRCRQLTGLTEPPKSSICMVTMNRPTR
jgi:hypothetical protein